MSGRAWRRPSAKLKLVSSRPQSLSKSCCGLVRNANRGWRSFNVTSRRRLSTSRRSRKMSWQVLRCRVALSKIGDIEDSSARDRCEVALGAERDIVRHLGAEIAPDGARRSQQRSFVAVEPTGAKDHLVSRATPLAGVACHHSSMRVDGAGYAATRRGKVAREISPIVRIARRGAERERVDRGKRTTPTAVLRQNCIRSRVAVDSCTPAGAR